MRETSFASNVALGASPPSSVHSGERKRGIRSLAPVELSRVEDKRRSRFIFFFLSSIETRVSNQTWRDKFRNYGKFMGKSINWICFKYDFGNKKCFI